MLPPSHKLGLVWFTLRKEATLIAQEWAGLTSAIPLPHEGNEDSLGAQPASILFGCLAAVEVSCSEESSCLLGPSRQAFLQNSGPPLHLRRNSMACPALSSRALNAMHMRQVPLPEIRKQVRPMEQSCSEGNKGEPCAFPLC
jgi:hypothetical protein